MKFTKMHGLGNDYIYVDAISQKIENPNEISKFVSDRHFGIGSDGLVLILPSDVADFKMRMFNSDGSEAEMCGNAIRCVGKFVYDKKMTDKSTITIETLAGIKVLEMTVENGKVVLVKVDMGEPILKAEEIPVLSEKHPVIDEEITAKDYSYYFTCVSMGNPHAITYIENVSEFPLEKIGPLFEIHEKFPRKTNVEFVELIDKNTVKMRVWERGAGETLACGTGACAVLVASILKGYVGRKSTVKLLGGDLIIEWNENDNHIYMTGPATTVFEGEIDI
ncbi:diaminopimelate epimerase [Methanococcus maripaludis]|uniref:Diaminopimelate epimerase n=1 Tax=Methanococcus maripaludis TaxID=39152 RepID=A0A2L1C866_METMI|nr:diaminopimelate epimerase [Methanococcus maripaludis]AVB75493.1 Diaminopimelate epimerase [Methanococcus maripaludis]MBA2863818.1 diaminopimelate epimerase [Methanococcus maripaludis]MBB6496176.1 diaminopimelate epimerase [Methanococcus maripaludis]